MTPTREETLQAERDAAVGALADAVRKARDEALEEVASMAAERAANAKRRRDAAKAADMREAYLIAEGQWDWIAPLADDIRALKSKP